VFPNTSTTTPFFVSGNGWFWQSVAGSSIGNKAWSDACYGDGKIVAVTANAGNDQQVCYSTDALNWTLVTSSAINVSRYPWRGVCYSRELGLFCMVGDAGRIMTSPDALTWTFRGQVNTINFWGVCYGAGRFIAVGSSGTDRIATSTDGINWTVVSSPVVTDQPWYSVCYGNGRFVAVCNGASTSSRAMYSTDGLTWTGSNIAGDYVMQQIIFGAGRFVTVNAGTTALTKIAHSVDGVTWSYIMPSGVLQSNQFRGICYGNGMFISRYFTSGTNYVIASGAHLLG
jgi:hypothetical protein